MLKRKFRFKLVVLAAGVLFVLMPDRYLPGGSHEINQEGTFDSRPIEIQWQHANTAPYHFTLVFKRGVCDVVQLDASGAVILSESAEEMTDHGKLAPGEKLRFIPRPNADGYFHIKVGWFAVWSGLVTVARVVILASCLLGIAAQLFGWTVLWHGHSRKRLAVAAAIGVISGLVLYSTVHEGGHLLFGMLFGAQPNWHEVRWTAFSGEEPHAAFRYLSPEASPWMIAGGILLPTFVGLALIALWRLAAKRTLWWCQLLILIPGLILLFGNLSLFVDAGHALPLAFHFGLSGWMAQIAALSPAIATLIVLIVIAGRVRSLTPLLSEAPV